jgi:hypothetical protein
VAGRLTNLVMPLACLLIAFAVGAPNLLSFDGCAEGFDPSRQGVVGVARHPLLLALALWAGVHALANGDLAHLLLFGGFALLGMRALDRHRRRLLGEAEMGASGRAHLVLAARCPDGWALAVDPRHARRAAARARAAPPAQPARAALAGDRYVAAALGLRPRPSAR